MDRGFLEQALSLPFEDRAELANELLRSLKELEIHPAWDDEIIARAQAVLRGECETIDWQESLKQAREVLSKVKQS